MHNTHIIFETSEQGGKATNQDRYAYFSNDDKSLCFVVVADGVGGSSDGGVAAQIIVDQSKQRWPSLNRINDYSSFLTSFVAQCHQKIKAFNETGHSVASTIVAMVISESEIVSVHAGDSRIVQLNSTDAVKQTKDHSLAYAKFLLGEITKDEVATHSSQNQLLSCLSGDDDYEAEIQYWDRKEGKHFVICSDGFWECCSTSKMIELVSNENREFIFSSALDEHLVQHPKHDNTTGVILTVNEVKPLGQTTECLSTIAPAKASISNINSEKKSWKNLFIYLFILLLALLLIIFGVTSKQDQPVTQTAKTSQSSQMGVIASVKSIDEVPSINQTQLIDNAESQDEEVNQSKSINQNFENMSEVQVSVAEGDHVEAKILEQLKDRNAVSSDSLLVRRRESSDEYATIISSQLLVHDVPVFGAVIRYQVVKNTVEILSGKVANLDSVPLAPKHNFLQCITKYQVAEKIDGKTIEQVGELSTLFIDPASQGYFWRANIRVMQGADLQEMEVHLLDETCSPLRTLPVSVSS